jgi:DNA-binding Xre family transcriptional regulator
MIKEINSDLDDVKRLTIENIRDDIKKWLAADDARSREQFAAMVGFSTRSLEFILGYKEGDKVPNLTSSTINGIMRALECETYYTPKHEIK